MMRDLNLIRPKGPENADEANCSDHDSEVSGQGESSGQSPTAKDTIKVLFIYPPVRLNAPPRYPPFGLLYLGAVLQEAGIEVEIMDLNLLRLTFDEVMRQINEKDFDIVGISGMTTVYYYMKLLSLELKNRYPHIPIIGGGSACSASPRVVLENTGIDVCCIGEGEPIIVELVNKLIYRHDLSHISGIYYRDENGEIHETPNRPRMLDVKNLPYPAYDLVDMGTYNRNNSKVYCASPQVQERIEKLGIDPDRASRPMTLFTKRGCPFRCNFCYRNFGRKVVYSTVDYTLDHMSFLEEKYDTCHFIFNDEIFNVSKDWVMEFCERLIAEDRRYILGANNGFRANVLDRDMLVAMKEAGFCQIGIGIESFYDPTLKAMDKGQTSEQIYNALKLTQEMGLFINSAQLLFGYETDGFESMKANVEALTALGFTSANFSIPCPYPGTYLYNVAVERGLIGDEEGWLMELADRDISDRVINLSTMSDKKLHRYIQWGIDQLQINHLRTRRPFVAGILDHVQPFLRKLFNINAYSILEWSWGAVRYGKFRGSSTRAGHAIADIFAPEPEESGHADVNDERIYEEAFQLLEKWEGKQRPNLVNQNAA